MYEYAFISRKSKTIRRNIMGILTNRSFLTLLDYTQEEIKYLLDFAFELKEKKHAGKRDLLLSGKNVVLLFEKTSTRTRCAFEVAAYDEGANVTFLTNSQMGEKESLEDTACVLGRMYDGIEFRGYKQETVEMLSKYSKVPVWNGLTDKYHPTQALADIMTMLENSDKPFNDMKLTFLGDAHNNVANSLMIICAKLGMQYCAIAPKELFPDKALTEQMSLLADNNNGKITITDDTNAVIGSDALYTDVWVSMGEGDKFAERIKMLEGYRVTSELMKATGNKDVIFLHCLPSFHDLNTTTGKKIFEQFGIKEMEVSDEVFRSESSKVFDEAENRLHTIKAVMCATLV